MPRIKNRTAERYRLKQLSGWTPDAKHAAEFAAKNPTPVFSVAAPNIMAAAKPRDVFIPAYFSTVAREEYGLQWKYEPQHQLDGTCVGQGWKWMIDQTLAINKLVGGMRFPGRVAVAPLYAGGRVEIAGQPGRWDGSNGSWTAEFVTRYGVVTMKRLGLEEHSKRPDELKAVDWASRREGVPAEYEAAAKIRQITKSTLILTVEEACAALYNLQPIAICTSLIPSSRRDQDGVARMSRQGGHCTVINGVRHTSRGKLFAYHQSWGNWASGPYGWKQFDPSMEYASATVDITEADLAAVLRSRDCYTVFGVSGTEPIDDTFYI